MNRACIVWLIFAAALAAQVAEPRIGFARSVDGTVIDIRGVSGSFVVDRTGVRADAAAWTGQFEVSLTDGRLTISNAAGEALGNLDNAADAVFGFSADGDSVAVFRPVANDLSVWRAGSWTTAPVIGAIQSIAIENNTSVIAAMARDSGIAIARIRVRDGAIEDESALDGAAGPVLVMPHGRLIIADGDGVLIRERNGSSKHVDVSGPVARLAALGDGWVYVVTTERGNFAVRLGDSPTVFAIPEPQQ